MRFREQLWKRRVQVGFMAPSVLIEGLRAFIEIRVVQQARRGFAKSCLHFWLPGRRAWNGNAGSAA